MTEVFDMNMNELVSEESEFIQSLQGILENVGVEIDASSLATILNEYEMAKMDFLRAHIMQLLEERGSDLEGGPVKVVVSQSGLDFEDDEEELTEQADTTLIS